MEEKEQDIKKEKCKRKHATRRPVYDTDGKIVDWHITKAEVVRLTGLSQTTVWRYTIAGMIPTVSDIGRYKYSEKVVRHLLYDKTLELIENLK